MADDLLGWKGWRERVKRWRDRLEEVWGERVKVWLGVLMILYFGGAAVMASYQGLDRAGYLSHTEVTDITVSPNWLVGETRQCNSPVLHGSDATGAGKPHGYAMGVVVCDDSPVKTFSVTFYGRTEQREYSGIQWSCTKGSSAFTCKQTGGSHNQ
jgi:hypothetical protein